MSTSPKHTNASHDEADRPTTAVLLEEVTEFLQLSGMPPTSFGLKAASDPHFLRRLQLGRPITTTKLDRVRAYMRAQSQQGGSNQQSELSNSNA